MEKILSIIVPTYNMESYLSNCIGSFINSQCFDDIEILIVNDGSRDNSLVVANDLARRYPKNIRVIDKENGGHGSTINVGVQQCMGKYFKVVDADDWVNSGELDKLVEKLSYIDTDCVICNYTEFYEAENKELLINVTNKFKHGVELAINEYLDHNRLAMHSVTYKTEVYRGANIKLTEKCFYVDTEFIYYPLAVFNTIICYPYNVYKYRLQREGQSVSKEGFLKHIDNHRIVMTELCNFYNAFSDDKPELKKYLMYEIGNHLSYQQSFLIYDNLKKQEWVEYRNFIRRIKKLSPPIYKAMSFKRRLIIHLGSGCIRFLAKIGFCK